MRLLLCARHKRYTARLTNHTSTELVPRPTPLPTGLRGWLKTFAFAFLDALPSSADREAVIDEVCRRLEVDMKHDVGEGQEERWTVMYVRLRFKAWKQ